MADMQLPTAARHPPPTQHNWMGGGLPLVLLLHMTVD